MTTVNQSDILNMAKSKKGKIRPQSYYSLTEIKQRITNREVVITPDVSQDALKDFGWGISEIKDALMKLQPKHFYKTDRHEKKSTLVENVYLDVYKARINGENVYTHFYMYENSNILVIDSFKRI